MPDASLAVEDCGNVQWQYWMVQVGSPHTESVELFTSYVQCVGCKDNLDWITSSWSSGDDCSTHH